MRVIETTFVYTVELTSEDVRRLLDILHYAERSKNKPIKIAAQELRSILANYYVSDGVKREVTEDGASS